MTEAKTRRGNIAMRQDFSRSNIAEGFDVYGSDESKIGTVGQVFDDYFKMDTGFLGLGEDYYVPFSSIARVTVDRVYLSIAKDRLKSMGWHDRPSARTETSRSEREFAETGTRGGGMEFEGRERTIPLREEELEVERRSRQAGEVRISKDVEEERKRMDVPYSKEEVHVERRPASGQTTGGEIGEGETIRVPVSEEEVDISKRTVTKEELAIDKDKVEGQKRVEETLRREVPRVEKEGDIHSKEESSLSDEERRRRERGPF
jgi:uncharacterized protein (TIGR02271 family)